MSDTEVMNYSGPAYQDFFNPVVDFQTYTLPDKLQTITFKVMSEGERMDYQRKTNKPIKIDRRDDSATIRPDLAQDRFELIMQSVTDWTLVRKDGDEWLPIPFSKTMLGNWVKVSSPKIIGELEKAIQKANPWMQAEMSIADIDEEIANLQDLREQKVKEESEKNF